MSSKKQEAVKVVLMDTQYVETDPVSFKSVVQKLTGKDSSVAWIKESNSSSAADSRREVISVEVNKLEGDVVNDDNNNYNVSPVSMLSKGVSFKDVEVNRLIFDLEFPPPEELQWLTATDGCCAYNVSWPTTTAAASNPVRLQQKLSVSPSRSLPLLAPYSHFLSFVAHDDSSSQQPRPAPTDTSHSPQPTRRQPARLAHNWDVRSPRVPLSPAQS
ncbi:hypothetical protein WN943_012710 [Citrus x changshan-huyou]